MYGWIYDPCPLLNDSVIEPQDVTHIMDQAGVRHTFLHTQQILTTLVQIKSVPFKPFLIKVTFKTFFLASFI